MVRDGVELLSRMPCDAGYHISKAESLVIGWNIAGIVFPLEPGGSSTGSV